MRLLLTLMYLVLLVVLWRLFGGYRVTQAVQRAEAPLPKSLARLNFTRKTRGVAEDRYLDHQLTESLGRPPTLPEMQTAHTGLADIRASGRTELHLRHVVPDSLIRRLTIQCLRQPTEDGFRTLRGFYEAAGATGLLGLWDDIYTRVRGKNGKWYQVLGKSRVKELSKFLANLQEDLFLSEAQGNLHAGTYIDVTEEGIVLLGEARVRRIVDATVHALEAFGVMPSIHLVGREYMLGDEHATGELSRFGYRKTRTHDPPVDPLQHMSHASAEVVLRNTPPSMLLGYFRENLTARRLLYGCILLLVSHYLSGATLSALDP